MRSDVRRRAPAAGFAAAVLLVLSAAGAAAGDDPGPRTRAGEDRVELLDAFDGYLALRAWQANPDPLVAYARAPLCNVNSQYLTPEIDGECAPPDGTVVLPWCDGEQPVEPLWRRTRPTPTSTNWSDWEMLSGWACPDDLLPPFSQEDFRQLTIKPLTAHRQPSGEEALVNKPLIVYADAEHRTFRTDLFGFGIDVDVYPVEYTWEFGDGETLTTVDPGSPYPSFDVAHTYAEPLTARVALTTTWKGRYRVDEDPDHEWRDITGTALTTTPFAPFDVIELRSTLVG